MLDRIKACFTESIQTQIAAAEALPDAISRAAMTLVQSLLNGNKILCCGNGTSAANAQHFAASMINRFETERPGLPAIALNTDNVVLTAIANDRLHDEIYAKQVRALGHAGDVLLAISTRGNSRDIVKAVEAAVTRDMTIVALTGYDGGELAIDLDPTAHAEVNCIRQATRKLKTFNLEGCEIYTEQEEKKQKSQAAENQASCSSLQPVAPHPFIS